jgi:hypothetical protein
VLRVETGYQREKGVLAVVGEVLDQTEIDAPKSLPAEVLTSPTSGVIVSGT